MAIYCQEWRTPIMRASAFSYWCAACAQQSQQQPARAGMTSVWRVVSPADYTTALLETNCACGVLLQAVADGWEPTEF